MKLMEFNYYFHDIFNRCQIQSQLIYLVFTSADQWSVAEGMLVWCKFRKYPYWPAMVREK